MTTGQLLFYGGVALLGLTVVLAIFFVIKKPKYTPESAAYDGPDSSGTQGLRNGYPTDRMTIRRETARQSALKTGVSLEETELLMDATAGLFSTSAKQPTATASDVQRTELVEDLQHISEESAFLLRDIAAQSGEQTEMLPESSPVLDPSTDTERGETKL